MNNWKEVKLGEICEFQNGFAFKSKDFSIHGNTKVIKIKELKDGNIKLFSDTSRVTYQDSYLNYIIHKNDNLVALTGDPVSKNNPLSWVGRISQNRNSELLLLNQRVCKLIPHSDKLNNNYIFYFFRQFEELFKLASKATGSASQANISTKILSDTIIPLPPLPEQKAIADTLSSLDNKIALNNKMNKNLEAQAQAIFKSWFVDFEPFQDGEFVDSELGKIPKGWRVGTLGEISDISSGKRPLSKVSTFDSENIVPIIGASSVMGYTNKILYDEKILITGRVGTHGIIQRSYYPCWASDNTLVIKSNYYEFVYQLLTLIDYASMNRGSTQPLITQTDLKNVTTIIPVKEVLDNFEILISQLMQLMQRNQQQTAQLTNLRDTLLPKLMSGEVRVPIKEVE